MFQPFDSANKSKGAASRAAWMALLARAPIELLEQGLSLESDRPLHWLRRPETGLFMVQGRVGGTAERFNLGEVTVTRCALRLGAQAGHVGVAYVMGRNHRKAELAAKADALLQEARFRAVLQQCLLNPIRQHLDIQEARRTARAKSSKVDFFTVARESSAPGGDESE